MRYLSAIIIPAIVALSCTQRDSGKSDGPVQIRKNTGNTLMTGWYRVVDSSAFRRKLDRDSVFYYIDPTPIVTAENIKEMEVFEDSYGGVGIGMIFNDDVISLWEQATAEASKERESIAFILDDRLMAVPVVQGAIPNGQSAVNRDVYSKKDLEAIVRAINDDRAIRQPE